MNDTSRQPAFSIVIPTHNRAHLLPRAIRSVLAQTFTDFELIVVDDVSTDETRAVVESFGDERIVYIRRETNGGAAATRNTGIRAARGAYVTFLDDDDEYLPDFLLEMDRAFKQAPEAGFGWCGTRVIKEQEDGQTVINEGVWQPKFADLEQAHYGFLRSRRVGTNCGITVRRDCFEKVGLFDETLKKAEDTDFLIRIVRHYPFTVAPAVLINIYHHGGPRLTTYDARMAEAYERIIEKNMASLRANRDCWVAVHYKAAWINYHANNRAQGRTFMRRVLQKRPLYWKAWGALLMFEMMGPMGQQLHRRLSVMKKKATEKRPSTVYLNL